MKTIARVVHKRGGSYEDSFDYPLMAFVGKDAYQKALAFGDRLAILSRRIGEWQEDYAKKNSPKPSHPDSYGCGNHPRPKMILPQGFTDFSQIQCPELRKKVQAEHYLRVEAAKASWQEQYDKEKAIFEEWWEKWRLAEGVFFNELAKDFDFPADWIKLHCSELEMKEIVVEDLPIEIEE